MHWTTLSLLANVWVTFLYDTMCSTYILVLYFQLDVNGSGSITSAELGQAFTKIGENVPGYKLREMIGYSDRAWDGTLGLKDFIRVQLGCPILKGLCPRTCNLKLMTPYAAWSFVKYPEVFARTFGACIKDHRYNSENP